jgi:DNA-3-methyladenine glycosylase
MVAFMNKNENLTGRAFVKASGKMSLTAETWRSTETVELARRLLGRHLVVRRPDGSIQAHRITEVEAYDGEADLASHASRGRTCRTEVMFGPGGVWYVYLCYGIHEMLNLVTGPRDRPAAILIRGLEGLPGPGRLTRALGIDRRFNGAPATRKTGLWLEDRDGPEARFRIRASARIGVDYAGPVWARKPWRFTLVSARVPEDGIRRASRPRSRS